MIYCKHHPRRKATWMWAEYDDETPYCQDCMIQDLETLVLDRTTAQIEVLGPEKGLLGQITIDGSTAGKRKA